LHCIADLPVDWQKPDGECGVVVVGVRGHGARVLRLAALSPSTADETTSTTAVSGDDGAAAAVEASASAIDGSPVHVMGGGALHNFVESVEAAHSDHR
jgi:hypothetical protein